MSKILHITASYKPAYVYGGPIYAIAALCETLANHQHEVSVLTTTANGKKELEVVPGKEYQVDNVKVRYFRRWTKDHSHLSPGLFRVVFTECRKFEVVHIHSWWNLVSIISVAICIIRGVTPILTLRGTLSGHTFSNNHTGIKRLFHQILGRKLLSMATIHVTSEKEANETRAEVAKGQVIILPNLLHFPDYHAEPVDRRSPDLKLLFLGRVHPVKNIELLLETLRRLGSRMEWQLDIVGTGEISYINALQEKYADLEGVHWVGEKHDSEKLDFIDRADVLVLLSHTENFGNVLLEALNRGTGVLISEHVGLRDYVRTHQLGWVIQPDQETLSDVLIDVAGNRSKLNDIRKRAPELIRTDFNNEKLVESYLEMYEFHGHDNTKKSYC